MPLELDDRIESALGSRPSRRAALAGGCIGEVYRVELEVGRSVVIKVDDGGSPKLDIEGYMLRYLRARSALPVPEVLHCEPDLLAMTFIDGDSHFTSPSQEHAAELLASLHGIVGDAHGLERDTLIGGLHQPNPATASWLEFFREQRLLHMARKAHQEGRMPAATLKRLESLADNVDRWLIEPPRPSLLHGDVWTTNVLAERGRITGFIDPAVYYGHPEIELAFTTLFGTFGDAFFRLYHELRPIPDGFFEERRDIYNLYPLLVHVRLFGGGYLGSVEQTLRRLGY
jgi:fructosamine-3-kinase